MRRYSCTFVVMLAILATNAPAAAPLSIQVGPLATTPLERHEAVVSVRNDSAAPLKVALEWAIKPPMEVRRAVQRVLAVPAHGTATCSMPYELFEPGPHKLTCVGKTGEKEAARWDGKLVAGDPDQVPRLLPNYYRRHVAVSGGRDVTTSCGPLVGAGDGLRAVAAQGAVQVRFATDAGVRRLPVTVVPRPSASALVSIADDNRLLAGGKPWFPLGIYTTPSTEVRCRELREAGFDLVCLPSMPPAPLRQALDRLEANGLRAWVPLARDLQFAEGDVAAKKRRIEELVATVGGHKALALWESLDEPAWGGSAAWGLREGYQFLRALDPRRPLWTNHAPRNRIDTLVHYNQATDIAGCDIYPVPMPQTQSNLPNKTLSVVGDETRKSVASVGGDKPVFMVLQGFAWKNLSKPGDPRAVYPSFAESRFMAYDAIVSGANGILYWGTHSTPAPSRFWSDLKTLVSELRAMAPVLETAAPAAESTAWKTGDPVRASHRRLGGDHVLLVVNRTGTPRTAEASAPGAAGMAWHALFGDPAPKVEGHRLRVDLPAWGVAVLTTSARFRPVRRSFEAELVHARPAQPIPVEPGNAIRNPSFEADTCGDGVPDGWQVRCPFTTRLDASIRHSGKASLCVESSEAGFRPLAVQNGCATEGNRRYRLSAWIRSDTPRAKGRIYVEWVAGGRFHGHAVPWTSASADWSPISLEFNTTPDPAGGLYTVVQVDGPGRVWFDDLRLELVP